MKPIRKRKQIEVKYKGFRAVQTPWNSMYGKQYALRIINDEGKLELHAGYRGKCSTRKELKLDLMNYVNREREILRKVSTELYNDDEDDEDE